MEGVDDTGEAISLRRYEYKIRKKYESYFRAKPYHQVLGEEESAA